MEWLINIIVEIVLARFGHIIMMWHGLLVDIPDGWVLCDGNNGTPDLSNKFIFGTTAQGIMNTTGGTTSHNHDFTSNTHKHHTEPELENPDHGEGNEIVGTAQGPPETNSVAVTGTTDNEAHLPLYYRLAFIMKT